MKKKQLTCRKLVHKNEQQKNEGKKNWSALH